MIFLNDFFFYQKSSESRLYLKDEMQIIFQRNSGTRPDQAQSRLESGCCMQRPLGGATPLMLLR